MKKSVITITAVLCMGFMQEVYANYYDQCAAILAEGVFETSQTSTDIRAQSDFEQYMCSSAYSLEKEKIESAICRDTSSSGNTNWSSSANIIDLISGSGNANIHKAFREKYCSSDSSFNYSAWSADHCQSSSSSDSSSAITHTLMRTASDSIVAAWKECVKTNKSQNDLICFGKEYGDIITFHIDWDHRYASTLNVDRFTPVNLKILGPAPITIKRGEDKFAFERKAEKKYSLIQLSTTETFNGQTQTVSCEYAIPPAACKNPIYREGRSAQCGIESYIEGRGAVCGVKKYKSKRDAICGVELYNLAKTISCGLDKQNINHGDGGCAACGGECGSRGGTSLSCSEENHRGLGWHRTECNLVCGVTNTCRHPDHGVEKYNLCESPEFGVEEYKTCEDASFGVIYNKCRLPQFGVERCAD